MALALASEGTSNPIWLRAGSEGLMSSRIRLHQVPDIVVMTFKVSLQFRKFSKNVSIFNDGAAHSHKGKNYEYAHFDRALGVQDSSCHDRTMLGEHVWTITRTAMPFT
jgi:ABC-type microcin C transport system permease subunit YejE